MGSYLAWEWLRPPVRLRNVPFRQGLPALLWLSSQAWTQSRSLRTLRLGNKMRMDLSAEGDNRQIQAWASHVAFWHL